MEHRGVLWFFFFAFVSLSLGQFDVKDHLATWTQHVPQQDSSTYTTPPAGCTPHTVVYLGRHGNRYPSSGSIRTLNNLAKKLATGDPIPQFAFLKTWENPSSGQVGQALAPSGRKTLYDIAKRFKTYFPSVYNISYDVGKFSFSSTSASRTALSGHSFGYGLFEGQGTLPGGYEPVFVQTGPAATDILLRPFDACDNYNTLVGTPAASEQYRTFVDANFPGIVAQVQKTTGITTFNFTADDVPALWSGCKLEAGTFGNSNGLCSIFDESSILKLEYSEDLDDYWQEFYGFDLNWQFIAPWYKELVNDLTAAINNTNPVHFLYFAQSENINPALAFLGLYKDAKPLKADFIDPNRLFRTSLLTPFGANIAFSLYQCPAGEYKVKMLHNEKEILIPGCSDLYCSFKEFLGVVNPKIQAIDFNKVCLAPTTTPSTSAPSTCPPTTCPTTPPCGTCPACPSATCPPAQTCPPCKSCPDCPASKSGHTININFEKMFGDSKLLTR